LNHFKFNKFIEIFNFLLPLPEFGGKIYVYFGAQKQLLFHLHANLLLFAKAARV